MWPYWYMWAKCQPQTFLFNSPFLARNPCLDYCNSDPFSLYMSETGNLSKFSHSSTMCPWEKCCVTLKRFVILAARPSETSVIPGQRFSSPLLHLGVCWSTSSVSMLQALQQWCSANNGIWPSSIHTRPLWGKLIEQEQVQTPHHVPHLEHHWNLAPPSVRLGERNPDS